MKSVHDDDSVPIFERGLYFSVNRNSNGIQAMNFAAVS